MSRVLRLYFYQQDVDLLMRALDAMEELADRSEARNGESMEAEKREIEELRTRINRSLERPGGGAAG